MMRTRAAAAEVGQLATARHQPVHRHRRRSGDTTRGEELLRRRRPRSPSTARRARRSTRPLFLVFAGMPGSDRLPSVASLRSSSPSQWRSARVDVAHCSPLPSPHLSRGQFSARCDVALAVHCAGIRRKRRRRRRSTRRSTRRRRRNTRVRILTEQRLSSFTANGPSQTALAGWLGRRPDRS